MAGTGTVAVPVLETARLRLRGHRVDDFETFAAIWGDPDVVRYISGRPSTREESWLRLLRHPGLWVMLGYGYWAIEEKATGRLVGDIGYGDFKRTMEPPLEGMPELGWVLAREAQGKGMAREALAAVLAWGRERFGTHRAACIIDPDNTASIRLAVGAGFHLHGHAALYGDRVQVYVRDEA